MKDEPFVIERTYNAPIGKVWKAITDRGEMEKWYFRLKEFKLEVGFEFRFWGGPDETRQYHHVCVVTEVIKQKKIAYSWRFEGYPGNSIVTFELFEEGNNTRLKLTHAGLETFPQEDDFARHNFEEGWTHIIGKSLKEYLEK